MNKNILYILLLFSLTSCFEERIDLDLNEGQEKMVVTGWITDQDRPQFINLSLTTNFLGKQPINHVSGAMVTLQGSESIDTLTENETGKYFLPADWVAVIGEPYSLSVNYDGEQYNATQTMRPSPEIEELDFQPYTEDPFEEEESDSIFVPVFNFQEMPGEGDAFYMIAYKKSSSRIHPSFNGDYFDDEFIDGEYLEDITVSSEEGEGFIKGETAVVELHAIEKKTRDYIEAVQSFMFRGGPFDPPPVNVPTNISNDAVGFFIMSSVKTAEIKIE